jgi:hypothetical protein
MNISGGLVMDPAMFRRVALAQLGPDLVAIRIYAAFAVLMSGAAIAFGVPIVGWTFGIICMSILIVGPDRVVNKVVRRYVAVGPGWWRYEADEGSFRIVGPYGTGEARWRKFRHIRQNDEMWLLRPRFGRHYVALPKAAFSEADQARLAEFLTRRARSGRRSSAQLASRS